MRFFGLKLQRLYLQLLLLNSCGLTESAEDEEQLAAEEEAFSIPGWKAPKTWPEVGITKQKFRQDYGDVWDSVSEALGAPRRAEIKRLRTQELHDHVNARHYKLGLEGTSKPQVVNGPSHDWTSVDKRSWAMEDSYAAMHNQPHQIKEPGHQGQRIFTAHSDSKYGSEKATYRHELDRQKLIRKLTYVRESELQMELISLPARLSELEEIVANSYRCEEYPSGEDSQEHASELSCGSADYSALQQEITSTKKRIVELQRGTDDSDSLVKFSSDHIFNEIDTDGNGLASMAEVTDWGARAATRGKLPSVARVGSLRKAALVSPDGHLIFDPKPGTCADAVRAACAGTVRDGCADCVKSRHSDKDLRAACPTWALVTEACAAGSIAEDVWPGLTRHGHWVMKEAETVLHDRHVDRVTQQLDNKVDMANMDLARAYIDARVKTDAASARKRLVSELILQSL